MKILIALILILIPTQVFAGTILSCSDGLEYKSALKLISNTGKYDRYRVIGTHEFIWCNK